MLNPATKYPGQHTGPSGEYPFGSARDVTAPSDGTGTPWEADLLDDLWGYGFAQLNRAGKNPSNSPDNVLASDRMDAASRIHGRQAESLQALLAGDFTDAESVWVSGYDTPGDGGESLWMETGVVLAPAAGTISIFTGRAYDANGKEFEPYGNVRTARMYGAKGDGVTNDQGAVSLCLLSLQASGQPGVVYFHAGDYLILGQITVGNVIAGTLFKGHSRETTKLNFSGAAPASFPFGYCIAAQGSMSVLPDLSVDVVASENDYTFSAAHGLEVDDVFAILNPNDSSLSPAQLFYRAGEYVRVATEDGGTGATGGRGAFADYTAAVVDVAKLEGTRFGVEDLHIVGIGNTETVGCIGVTFGRDVSMRRVKLSNTQAEAAMSFQSCYGVTVEDVDGFEHRNIAPNRRQMVGVWNCQRVSLSGLRGGATRAFVATGGKNAPWAVPCRDVLVSGCHVDTTTFGSASICFGGNTEYWRISRSTLQGIEIGGNFGAVDDCTIFAPGPGTSALQQGRAVLMREAHGATFTFDGVEFFATRDVGASVALVHLQDFGGFISEDGAFAFDGCRFKMRGFAGSPFKATAQSLGVNVDVEFDGCLFRAPSTSEPIEFEQTIANAGWSHVGFRGCDIAGVGVKLEAAGEMDFAGTRIVDASGNAIEVSGVTTVPFAEKVLKVIGCDIARAQEAGIYFDGSVGTATTRGSVLNTRSVSNNQSAGPGVNASVRGNALDFLLVQGCELGGAPQTESIDANDVASLIVVDFVSHDDLPTNFTGATISQVFGERIASQDFHRATGGLGLGGGTVALAGAGADELVIGDGFGNRGLTIRPSAAGVSRVVMGDAGDPDRFRMQGDHANQALDFYSNGGRDLRLFADAAEFGKVYADRSDTHGAFVVNIWPGGGTSVVSKGGQFASTHEVTQTGVPAAGAGQATLTFPEAYDEPPVVTVGSRGDAGGDAWTVTAVSTTSCVLSYNGSLNPGETTTVMVMKAGVRT